MSHNRYFYHLILVAVLIAINCANGVIQPPRLISQFIGQNSTNNRLTPIIYENEPAELLIFGPDTEELLLQEESSLIIRLTRIVETDLHVSVTIQSDPGILEFDPGQTLYPTDNSTSLTITYPAQESGDRVIKYHSNNIPGHGEIICKLAEQPAGELVNVRKAFVSVDIGRSQFIWSVMQLMGWLYFAAWSISFYPQVILNYKRKSVIGLNFDFIALNLIGFVMYSIYNISLLFSRTVQEKYYDKYSYSRIPVEYNDLFFSVHAAILTLLTIFQCFIYERGNQKLSVPSIVFVALTILAGFILYLISQFGYITILTVILYFSYAKLAVTLIKYIPQAHMNYKRKSTTGWSIHNIILDSTGGVLSLGQMLLAAYNYNDWISIFGNPTKFGLGIFSISFDILFILQHYVFYRNSNGSQEDIAPNVDAEGDTRRSGGQDQSDL